MSIKRKSISFVSLLVCMFILITCTSINAVSTNEQNTTVNSGYDYPIKPGTDEWVKLNDRAKRGDACQIPEDVLKSLSTDELVETVLNYPFLMDIYAYDTIQQGFKAVASRFNGLKELLQREDAGPKLLERYKQMEVIKDPKKVISKELFNLSSIEVILRQDEIMSKLNKTKIEELEKEVENKYFEKNAHPDIYGLTKAASYEVQADIQNSRVSAQTSYTVYTPNGTAVSVEKLGDVLTSDEKTAYADYVTTNYPGATILRSATYNYNCHSYAWYNQSTSNTYWMNDPSSYMNDGSYTYTTTWNAGRKMYYNYPGNEHSAIVTASYYGPPAPGYDWSSLTLEVSKWGPAGLIQHRGNNCPYYVDDSYMEAYYR